jgi:ATP-dependent Lon protease
MDEGANPMIPQRHNMKKESASVKKFVKLITAPIEDNTIDTQIDQFKALAEPKQQELLLALERRPTSTDTGVNLMLRILTLKMAPESQALVLAKYNSLQSLDPSTGEYFKLRNWLDKVVSVPFGLYKEIPIKLEEGSEACARFMQGAQRSLNEAVYGQEDTKLQILQYITTKIANPGGRGTSLLLVGPPGIGKTSVIKNGIAKALGLPFQFISLGGDSDASTYTGHQLVYESSHCGKIVNSLIASKSMSTIILFDEVDKISATPKGEEVQNMLIHLTDPASNEGFEDKYLSGIPIDLSKVMFVFSANDINKIDRVLLDRLMTIELKGYDLKQKTTIAENYLLPAALKDVSLTERVAFGAGVVTHIIEEYAKEEMGVRELKRCVEQIVQKINMLRLYNAKELPFHIKDFALPFTVKKEHVDLFLKKKEKKDAPPFGMYA